MAETPDFETRPEIDPTIKVEEKPVDHVQATVTQKAEDLRRLWKAFDDREDGAKPVLWNLGK